MVLAHNDTLRLTLMTNNETMPFEGIYMPKITFWKTNTHNKIIFSVGFLVVAHESGTEKNVGIFINPLMNEDSKMIDCKSAEGSIILAVGLLFILKLSKYWLFKSFSGGYRVVWHTLQTQRRRLPQLIGFLMGLLGMSSSSKAFITQRQQVYIIVNDVI